MKKIKLGNRIICDENPPYFVADIGANHDGNLDRAFKLIELAKASGADAAKFQNFIANKIVSNIGFESLGGQISHQASWKKSVYEVYNDASISQEWTPLLKNKCKEVGIDFFTSPYDFNSVDHVDKFVDFYKIGSGDITWIEIIRHIASKGKPIMIATGASAMSDVERAIKEIEKYTDEIILMQCNTNYTLDKDKHKYVNLKVLSTFSKKFPNTILGLSDHTTGLSTVLGSIALGARVIEKHFTDDNNREGPDHKFAINPKNWRNMVDNSIILFESLGDGKKRIESNELKSSIVQRRCLRATKKLTKGDIIKIGDLEPLRPIPDDGIPPYMLTSIIGKRMEIPLNIGEHITLKHFKNDCK